MAELDVLDVADGVAGTCSCLHCFVATPLHSCICVVRLYASPTGGEVPHVHVAVRLCFSAGHDSIQFLGTLAG